LNCQETEKLLHGYVDGELDLSRTLELEEHLQTCSACAQAHRGLESLRTAIRSGSCYYEPPADLQARIHKAIQGVDRDGPTVRSHRLGLLAAAASLVVVALAGWGLLHLLSGRTEAPGLTEELLAAHIRSQMLMDHLIDVKSSNQHTVKPWFNGKLDFSPQVVDLADQGFTLVGGRLDYVDQRPVAAVVYERHKHVLNLFTWPSDQNSLSAPATLTRQGYHLLSWKGAGMTYWVVSDLNEAELRRFVDLIQSASGGVN